MLSLMDLLMFVYRMLQEPLRIPRTQLIGIYLYLQGIAGSLVIAGIPVLLVIVDSVVSQVIRDILVLGYLDIQGLAVIVDFQVLLVIQVSQVLQDIVGFLVPLVIRVFRDIADTLPIQVTQAFNMYGEVRGLTHLCLMF